jgi:3-phosphoshikimate 1-carboxyvinyltransferase
MHFYLDPGGKLTGRVRVPGDKSMSHRSIMLGSIAEGRTTVSGFLEGEDALATLASFREMGVQITDPDAGELTIEGVGLSGLEPPKQVMDVGNSGTSIRLMMGLLAGQSFDSVLTGDQSLLRRPMARVITPLSQMGALISSHEGCPPLEIQGGRVLTGIHYDLPVASAQVKSSVLLAGLFASGRTSVTEPAPTRDHTERMLSGFGYPVVSDNGVISLEGGGKLIGADIDIPADISSAAFFHGRGFNRPGF